MLLHFELMAANTDSSTHLSYLNTLDDDDNDGAGPVSEERDLSIFIIKSSLK